jgi:hypothetical protein
VGGGGERGMVVRESRVVRGERCVVRASPRTLSSFGFLVSFSAFAPMVLSAVYLRGDEQGR